MHEQPDIHARLMSKYPQVPEWWYAAIFGALALFVVDNRLISNLLFSLQVSMFVFGVISIEVWPTQFPVWAFVLALVIGKILKLVYFI